MVSINPITLIPRCAVLIPHYRNPEGLQRSLASISATERVDIFIVDDGSGVLLDETAFIQTFKGQGHVYFIYLTLHQGIQAALNRGLEEINQCYPYIARLDCGDICVTDRFNQQMTFLDQHPDIALVGSAVTFVDQQGHPHYTLRPPETADEIKRFMHYNCAFIHPTVMWRSEAAQQLGYYPDHYPMAEDFAFFWLFVNRFATANLPAVLVHAELNPDGLSISKRWQQLCSRLRLQWQYFNRSRDAYYGLIKTLLLMLLPYRLVLLMKRLR